MPVFNNPHFYAKLKARHPSIYVVSLMIFFWTLFDCVLTYVTPILISAQGFSNTVMGAIIGSSSIVGAIFDFLICKFLKNTNFRRVFLLMFACCFIYPLLLWQAKTIYIFLIAMALWGIYYDFYGFGIFDFISHYTKKEEHTNSFGIVQVFRSLGGILAPLITGLVIAGIVDWRAFTVGWFFLIIAFLFFILLLIILRKVKPIIPQKEHHKRRNLFVELHLFKKLGKLMFPILILTFFLFLNEAFFWTLAPLYAEESSGLKQFGGIFLTVYGLPALILGWLVGSLTRKFGKKETAFFSLFIGSLILASFSLIHNPILIILITFVSSCFISLSLPAVNGLYADYIVNTPIVEGEIEALEDFSFNLGYIFGPFLAGLFADLFGIPATFSILGIIGSIIAFILFIFTKKRVVIHVQPSELK